MKQQETLVHDDDENRRCKVNRAREIIYEKGYAVNSWAVEGILKEQSLVPTLVSTKMNPDDNHRNLRPTVECILTEDWSLRIQPIRYASRRPDA